MHSLLRDYRLVLEPSWSGYADPRILAFSAYREHPMLVMCSCDDDTELLQALGSNLVPLALSASDWVHPGVFHPLANSPKKFDAVLNARWTLLKRHHILFRALREMQDPTFRVAILALNIPGDQDRGTLLRTINKSGFARQIEIFEDLPPAQVNEVLNQSKVNLLLSRQEGSNRSLFEGFFADVPGVAFANHIGIPKRHFTPETGRLIPPGGLAEALRFFRENWTRFHPRAWAMAHISPERSTALLNQALERIAREHGEPWTSGAVAKCNLPDLEYYPNPEVARGFPTVEDIAGATCRCRTWKRSG